LGRAMRWPGPLVRPTVTGSSITDWTSWLGTRGARRRSAQGEAAKSWSKPVFLLDQETFEVVAQTAHKRCFGKFATGSCQYQDLGKEKEGKRTP
jgi:hypothetical protein